MPHQVQGREQVWVPDQMLSQLTKVTPALRSSNMWAWVTRVGLCDVPREGLVLAPKRPHLVATRHWLQAARWNLSFRSMLSFQQRNRPDWQLLVRPLGVMPARLFLLTWEGDMPNGKPLKPDDFPVEVEGEELVTAEGKPIAKAKTPAIAEDIADRLNEDDCRKEQDRWSA